MVEHSGIPFDGESLTNTPSRLSKMYLEELLIGYRQSPAEILSKTFYVGNNDMVTIKEIPFVSLCAHHWLPFMGVAHVGYIPSEHEVVGLSKIPRLINCYARRFQIQEKMTAQIANALDECLNLSGCMVITKASHLCAQIRGIQSHGTEMVCSAIRGNFEEQDVRAEFLKLVKI